MISMCTGPILSPEAEEEQTPATSRGGRCSLVINHTLWSNHKQDFYVQTEILLGVLMSIVSVLAHKIRGNVSAAG